MKKTVLEWMMESGHDELPHPKVFTDIIMTRDFSKFAPKETDTEEEKDVKRVALQGTLQLFDLYTERMVVCVAGPKLYHPKIRHFEPMTTAMLPKTAGVEQLRIPASTEAMTVLVYMNNYKKWNAMHKWKKEHPRIKVPAYSSKRPNEHTEFKEQYSSGQVSTPEWGGWNDEGRKKFVKLQARIMKSRTDNKDRHVKHDQECVDRLYEKFKEMHRESDRPAKKPRTPSPTNRDDDEDYQYIMEV
jgi:hypothetical protein